MAITAILIEGESTSDGNNSSFLGGPNWNAAFPGAQITQHGTNGHTIQHAINEGSKAQYLSGSGTRVIVLWIGINDISTGGKDAAYLTNKFAEYITARRAEGWDKVLLVPVPAFNQYVAGATDYRGTARQPNVTTPIRNDFHTAWAATGADAIVDMSSLPWFDDHNQVGDTTYRPDKTHFTATGDAAIDAVVIAATQNIETTGPPDGGGGTSGVSNITLVNKSEGTFAGGTLTPTLPGGIAAGDFLFLQISHAGPSHGGQGPVTGRDGFTEMYEVDSGGFAPRLSGMFRFATAGQTAPAITFGASTGGSWSMAAYRGVNPAAPFELGTGATNQGTTIAVPGFTTTVDGSMIISHIGVNDNVNVLSAPAGWDVIGNGTGQQYHAGITFSKGQTAAGPTGNGTITWASSNQWTVQMLSLSPLTGNPFAAAFSNVRFNGGSYNPALGTDPGAPPASPTGFTTDLGIGGNCYFDCPVPIPPGESINTLRVAIAASAIGFAAGQTGTWRAVMLEADGTTRLTDYIVVATIDENDTDSSPQITTAAFTGVLKGGDQVAWNGAICFLSFAPSTG